MFLQYIKMHRKWIAAQLVFIGAAAAVFALYRLPVAAVGYTAVICLFFGAVFGIVGYGKFVSRHRRLTQLQREISVTLDNLPAPSDLLERDYQKLVKLQYDKFGELEAQSGQRERDQIDYYTSWVHQIKTPIAAMRLILQGGEFAERQELGEELLRIEQYVEMVLCYLRLEGRSSDYVIREYDVDAILRQAVRRNASVFIRKKLRLVYEPLGIRVVTDEKWLLFVIEQILSNALKYTAAGSISITLEAPKTVCIRDTGIGIAAEDLPRIFERGYTGTNGRRDEKASGIGLYLCRRICENLGHRITVTSSAGVGTEVRLDLKNAELEID